jgi:hypothetical protein
MNQSITIQYLLVWLASAQEDQFTWGTKLLQDRMHSLEIPVILAVVVR